MHQNLLRVRHLVSLVVLAGVLALLARSAHAQRVPQTVLQTIPGALTLSDIPENTLFNIRGGFVCFMLFLGGVAGIAAMFTRRAISGILFLLGCGLLAVDPIAEFVIFRIVGERGGSDYHTLAIVYCVLSAGTLALGVVCLVGALFTAARKVPTAFPVQPNR